MVPATAGTHNRVTVKRNGGLKKEEDRIMNRAEMERTWSSIFGMIDELDTMVYNGSKVLLSRKVSIDMDRSSQLIADLRTYIETAKGQSFQIISQRQHIIEEAESRAKNIEMAAEAKAEKLVAKEEIVRRAVADADNLSKEAERNFKDAQRSIGSMLDEAKRKANEIETESNDRVESQKRAAQDSIKEMTRNMLDFTKEVLRSYEESLQQSLDSIRMKQREFDKQANQRRKGKK
jgi:F0F1-type ATP synthase membrane subunit b/b'